MKYLAILGLIQMGFSETAHAAAQCSTVMMNYCDTWCGSHGQGGMHTCQDLGTEAHFTCTLKPTTTYTVGGVGGMPTQSTATPLIQTTAQTTAQGTTTGTAKTGTTQNK